MNARFVSTAALLLVASAGLLLIGASPRIHAAPELSQTRRSHPSVEARQLQLGQTEVIGLLGKRLGTRIVVSGQRAERVLLANPIAVEQVDGSALPQVQPIEVQRSPELQPGVRYTLEGYEAGSFEGEPTWHNRMVQQPYQYRPRFVITRVIKGPAK